MARAADGDDADPLLVAVAELGAQPSAIAEVLSRKLEELS